MSRFSVKAPRAPTNSRVVDYNKWLCWISVSVMLRRERNARTPTQYCNHEQ